ncbi:hypothetical protein LGK95_03690 [Clostridium algoriphilum]|nr:hypothetical protein [Clostridium algoriphilum]MCB2292638.1 hypothetical protein [Clostridium algoriphilum]
MSEDIKESDDIESFSQKSFFKRGDNEPSLVVILKEKQVYRILLSQN